MKLIQILLLPKGVELDCIIEAAHENAQRHRQLVIEAAHENEVQ
jgi:hypothetical protein